MVYVIKINPKYVFYDKLFVNAPTFLQIDGLLYIRILKSKRKEKRQSRFSRPKCILYLYFSNALYYE
jgi:hypothetical protein